MLLIVVSVALLIDSCVSKYVPGPGFVEYLPQSCPRNEGVIHLHVRHSLFTLFNELRWKIARGKKVKIMENHGARLMYGMRYSCGLEANASELLEGGEKASQSPKNGENQHPTYVVLNFTSKRGSSFSGKTADVFKQMKGDSNGREMLSSPYVPYFGCAYKETQKKRTQSLNVLCVFKRNLNEEPGEHSPCSSDSDCTLIQGSTCSDKLCWAPSTMV